MAPSSSPLKSLFDTLLDSDDSALRARAENFLFEERVGKARQAGYEGTYGPGVFEYENWLESHEDYLAGAVYTALPETFLSINTDAALPAAVVSGMGEGQGLIRIESLAYVLSETKVASLAELEQTLAVYNSGRDDPNLSVGDAKSLLQEVCRSLNQNPYAVRPRFAAFSEELKDDIDAPDWALRLRDRLGLAHLQPSSRFGPHPVVLMRYTVKEVAGRARSLHADHALVVPTVLDAEPYEFFHPAPQGQNYGRTLNLSGYDAPDAHERLASEVLHLKMDYTPSHIMKVGAIVKSADTSPARLIKLRKDHLACLQLLSGRDDFGVL